MPKSSKEHIDLDEKKVIGGLEKNAKESIDEIAKNCGFSRQKVWRVIKRLERNTVKVTDSGQCYIDQAVHVFLHSPSP